MRRELLFDRRIDRALDAVIYGGLIATLIWFVLKGLGYINTPLLLQQLPFITGLLALLGFVFRTGRFVEHVELKLSQHDKQFAHIDNDIEQLKLGIGNIKTDITIVKQRI